MTYTLDDLEAQMKEMSEFLKMVAPYRRNNRTYGSSRLEQMRSKVSEIEADLRERGQPLSRQEHTDRELNAKYPAAQHRDEVIHNGCVYRCIHYRSRSQCGEAAQRAKRWSRIDIPHREFTGNVHGSRQVTVWLRGALQAPTNAFGSEDKSE